MSFRVDLNRLDLDRKGVDPRVKVRFGFLVRERARLSSQEIDMKLREKAQEDSPGASLSDLIKKMVKEVAYGQARLSLTEFVQRFRKNRLPDLIAARFANSLFSVDTDVHLLNGENGPVFNTEPDTFRQAKEAVLKNIVIFLERNKLTSTETLYEFLKQQKSEWPMVDISKLFLEEYTEIDGDKKERTTTLREKVARKINDSLEGIASEAYREKFEEDKRGFVMGFMMGRVVKFDATTKKMGFDRKEFLDLITYLDTTGSALSDVEGRVLYDWLYYESREMAKYVEEQKVNATRFGVREEIVQAGMLEHGAVAIDGRDEKVFFEEGFDVKDFHDRYVKPALFRYHSKKLRKLKRVREVDLFHNLHDTVNLGRGNYTLQLRQYVKALLELNRSNPKMFLRQIREALGLQKSPLLKSMTNVQVEKQIHYFLGQVEEKFHRVVKEALAYRKDPAVKEACKYPQEVLECRDLASLMEWFVSPGSFKKQFSQYADMPDEQISYICATWLRDFMGTMDRMSDKDFVEAERRRNLLEDDMKESLQLRVLKNIEVVFRVLEELDKHGNPYKKPKYRVVIDPENLKGFLNGVDVGLREEVLLNPDLEKLVWKGKTYRVFPLEQKKFKKVQMRIPATSLGEKHRVLAKKKPVFAEALIYSGDDHFIHVKEELTRVISHDRGKEVTDESRWMLTFADPLAQEAFKSFLFARNPQGLIKVEDVQEGRFISNKLSRKILANSTKTFKEGQDFTHTLKMSYASDMPKKDVGKNVEQREMAVFQLEKAMLETQCQKLRELLITNLSKYTLSSHDFYRSQRAWPLLFNSYFSPEFFGDRFKEFQDQGFETSE